MKKNVMNALFIAVFMLTLTAAAFAAPDDSTLSQHIKEADGTSGQVTNTGSGVKTDHIQNNAVTTAKIGDNQVTTSKIVVGAVTTDRIADGAVTDSKITGPISASKIQSTGLNADTVDGLHAADFAPSSHGHYQSDIVGLEESLTGKADASHNHDSVYQKKYGQIVVVAKSGGDFTDPAEALRSITDASESKPYLVKIMPGVYHLTAPPANMVVYNYISVEGSGREATKLSCISDGSNASLRPCVAMACSSCSMSQLTVEMFGSGAETDAVTFHTHGVPLLYDMDILAVNGNNDLGIKIFDGGPTMKNVTITTNGTGVAPAIYDGATVTLENVTIVPQGSSMIAGVSNVIKGFIITNSKISGDVDASSGTVKAAHSQFGGAVSGSAKIVNCYDANFDPIPNQ